MAVPDVEMPEVEVTSCWCCALVFAHARVRVRTRARTRRTRTRTRTLTLAHAQEVSIITLISREHEAVKLLRDELKEAPDVTTAQQLW